MNKEDLVLKISNIEFANILIEEIDVDERFRQDYGDIQALASSISKDGLIQPIAVCKNTDPTPGSKPFKLLAGGRRHAAVSYIAKQKGLDTVSCRMYPGSLTELQIRMLEFAENLYRKSMKWQEEDKLKRRIFELQQQIHGKKVSTIPGAPGYSLTDLSHMTGSSKGSLSASISLADMMEGTPGINWEQFDTRSDALKAVKSAKRVIKQSEDAKIALKRLGEGDSKKKKLTAAYHVGDFLKGVLNIGDSTMDLVEIDPPYSIALEKMKIGYKYSGYNEIDPADYGSFMAGILRESYRTLKTNGWLICWFGPEPWFESMYNWIKTYGFRTSRLCGIWVKGIGQTMQPDRSLANTYEMFFYARKGTPLLNHPGSSNVFTYAPVHSSMKVHPTERPIELLEDILTTFAAPNSNILVPFAGSGNTMIAAAKNNMMPIGFDLTTEYMESYIIKVHKML